MSKGYTKRFATRRQRDAYAKKLWNNDKLHDFWTGYFPLEDAEKPWTVTYRYK